MQCVKYVGILPVYYFTGYTIFKETEMGRWVHLVCALYIPGVAFSEVSNVIIPKCVLKKKKSFMNIVTARLIPFICFKDCFFADRF